VETTNAWPTPRRDYFNSAGEGFILHLIPGCAYACVTAPDVFYPSRAEDALLSQYPHVSPFALSSETDRGGSLAREHVHLIQVETRPDGLAPDEPVLTEGKTHAQ
jgi:hypothetical protein